MAIVTRNQTNIRNNSARYFAISGTVTLLAKGVERLARKQIPVGEGTLNGVVRTLCEKIVRVSSASSSKSAFISITVGLIALLSRRFPQAFPAEQNELEKMPDGWFSEILGFLPQEARASVLDAYPENKYVREAAKSVILQRTITRLTHMIQVVDDMFSVFRGHLNQTRLEENIIFAIVGPLVTAFTMVNLDRPKIKQSALVKSSLHTILFGNISSIIDELIFRRLHSNGFTLSERHVNLWNSVICVLILSIGIIHGIRK